MTAVRVSRSLLFLFLSTCLTMFGQTSRGAVTGIVADASQASVPGAEVKLISQERNVTRAAVTNESGVYRFDAVDPGSYKVQVSKSGFQAYSTGVFVIAAAQTVTLDAKLELGTSTTIVEVDASVAQLQVEQPLRGGTISSKQSSELPFAGRNPVALALTLPGVSSNRGGFGVGTFSVNGSRGRSNNFLLDGSENNDISIAGQAFQVTNPDAIQEVSVQTANFDSEFGRAGGAVINTIIKSGTNNFNGSLGYLLESTRFNAISNTQALSTYVRDNNKPIPGTDQWFFGTFGGPIKKNKTFFFGAFQERRQVAQSTVNLTTLSAAGKATLRGIQPRSPLVDVYLQAIDGINATTQLSTQALGSGRPAVEIGTFVRTLPQKVRNYQPLVKIDHVFNEKNIINGRFAFDKTTDPIGGSTNFIGFDTGQVNEFSNSVFSYTRIISAKITNELRLPYNAIIYDFPNDGVSALAATLPSLQIQGLTSVGVATNIPQGRLARNYSLQDTVSITQGKHQFRFGADILNQRARQFAPFQPRGILSFQGGGGFTALGNFVDNFGGGGGTVSRDFGSPAYYPDLWRTAFFGQDRWRMNPSLTLTLGLRYEYFGLPMNSLFSPAFSGLFNVDPTTFAGPYSQASRVKADRNNFSPTLGIALNPSFKDGFLGFLFGDRQATFRSGFSMGYDAFFNNIASNTASAAPNLVATSTPSVISTAAPRGGDNWSTRLPTVSRAVVPLDGGTYMLDNLVNPYYSRWNFSIQRQLPFNLIFDTGYIGSAGVKLFMNEDFNPLVPANRRIFPQGLNASNFVASRLQQRYDPLQGARTVRTNGGHSSYHAWQSEVRRSFANGFSFTGNYTWSKLLDNATEVFAFGGGLTIPSTSETPTLFGGNPRERGVSGFDRTQRATFTYVYELPFLKTQKGILGQALGGWQIAGVTTFEAGVPFTVLNGLDADGFGGNATDRPDINPSGRRGVRAQISATSPTGYVNPENLVNNVAQPISPSDAYYIQRPVCTDPNGCRPGTLGRNTERSPGIKNWNLTAGKSFRITEEIKTQFRAEFYNLFNTPQFGSVSASAFPAAVGTLGSNLQGTLNGRFLDPKFQDGGNRVVRFMLRIQF